MFSARTYLLNGYPFEWFYALPLEKMNRPGMKIHCYSFEPLAPRAIEVLNSVDLWVFTSLQWNFSIAVPSKMAKFHNLLKGIYLLYGFLKSRQVTKM